MLMFCKIVKVCTFASKEYERTLFTPMSVLKRNH